MGIKQLPLIVCRLGNNPFCNRNIRHHGSSLVTPLHLFLFLSDLHSFFVSIFPQSFLFTPTVGVWQVTIITEQGRSVSQDTKKMSRKLTLTIGLCAPEWRTP